MLQILHIMKLIGISITVISFVCITCYSSKAQRTGDPGAADKNIPESTYNGSTETKGLFSIYMGKNRIGTYEAWMVDKGTTQEYHAKSDTKVKVIGTISIKYSLDCVYKDGKLVNSQVKSYRNNKLKGDTKITWSGSSYAVVKDGKNLTISDPFSKGSILLYFGEPASSGERYLSESEAIVKQIQKGNQSYMLAEPGSSKATEYIYKGAKLDQVNVPFTLGDFSVIRN